MKIDVVIGNPPYNGPTKGSAKLAPKFMNQFLDDPDAGIVSMIVPIHWQSGAVNVEKKGMSYKGIRQKFWNRGITIVKTDISTFFPNIGESICYFVSIPSETKKWIIDGVEYTIENPFELLKSNTRRTWEGVRDKILNAPFPRIPFTSHKKFFPSQKWQDLNTDCEGIRTFYSRKHWNLGRTHCVPTEVPPDYSDPKVLLNVSRWTRDAVTEYCFASDNISSHSWSRHYTVNTKKEADNLVSYIRDSKLFRYMLSHRPKECITPFMNSWTNTSGLFLPLLPLNNPYTDSELYELFNITEDEIEEIEKWTN